jgi:(p)ppGpp synthase/HD superfamily hydrolase
LDVNEVLNRFMLTGDIVIAGWLHDVAEDTGTLLSEIGEEFGKTVEIYVGSVSGFGANRRERNENVYKKLIAFPDAIPLKLADRIANTENCVKYNPELLKMYRKEYPQFREQLYPASGGNLVARFMWEHLDFWTTGVVSNI